ncbi:HAD hydrolase-like protein [Halalkalibacillus halophilus]|uniref:HAD hydrolase-like protein n=1 Tax=Halalkalibacillus halophilus TaxID=392827 RepID=UPI00041CB8B8
MWDLDGTIFDTYPFFTEIFIQVLDRPVESQDVHNKLKISFSHAIQYYGLDVTQIKQMKQLERSVDLNTIKPFPNVIDVLSTSEVNVIMTHKGEEETRAILNHYGWTTYFDEILTIDSGFPRKPDPASYRFLYSKYNLDLAIGDREIDTQPAKEIGMKTCLFQNPEGEADFHLSHYKDFFKQVNLHH